MKKVLADNYLFCTDRHTGSYFLKIGAGIFCLGHIIHYACLLGKNLSFYYIESDPNCRNYLKIIYQIIHIAYSAAMITIVFEYSNVIMNRRRGISKFAFMHCVAACLCLWAHLILFENYDSLIEMGVDREIYAAESDCGKKYVKSYRSKSDFEKTTGDKCVGFLKFDHSCYVTQWINCNVQNNVARRMSSFIPILYPFSIQFNILIVGTWWIMWHNVGNLSTHTGEGKGEREKGEIGFRFVPDMVDPEINLRKRPSKPLITQGDIITSANGLVLGSILFGLTMVSLIIYVMLETSKSCILKETAKYLSEAVNSFILFVLVVACIRLYIIISAFEVNPNPIEFLEDILLFLCVPAFFFLSLCSAGPYLLALVHLEENKFRFGLGAVVLNLLEVVQISIQTPMLCDALRRCSEDTERQRNKPGRSHITFILIGNMVLYVWATLKLKSGSTNFADIDFYGGFFYATIQNMCLPLILFFRFHSAVALSDIWNSLYKPGDHDERSDQLEEFMLQGEGGETGEQGDAMKGEDGEDMGGGEIGGEQEKTQMQGGEG